MMKMANMALFALFLSFVAVTGTPLNNFMDRVAEASGSEQVLSTMREIEISNRNMDTWWTEFAGLVTNYKASITYNEDLGTAGIKTESTEGDEIVCKKHVTLLETLNGILTQWQKVMRGWQEKDELLTFIWNHLTNQSKDAIETGLHCEEGASGASNKMCEFVKGLMATSKEEKTKLDNEKVEVDGYISDINNYQCECNMDAWQGDFTPCVGQGVKPVTIYKDCDVNQIHTKAVCNPIQSSCGIGEQTKTRNRIWDSKAGDESEPKVACPTGAYTEDGISGTLSEITSEQQTWTVTCQAGDYNGNCPVDCVWGSWDKEINDATCEAKNCADTTTNKQKAFRKKTSTRQYGGNFCFQDEDGDYEAKEQSCEYEKRVEQDIGAMADEITEWKTKVSTLTAAMCVDTNGPCKNGGTCKVVLNEKGNEVSSWCTCPSGFSGSFCEQVPQSQGKPSSAPTFGGDSGKKGGSAPTFGSESSDDGKVGPAANGQSSGGRRDRPPRSGRGRTNGQSNGQGNGQSSGQSNSPPRNRPPRGGRRTGRTNGQSNGQGNGQSSGQSSNRPPQRSGRGGQSSGRRNRPSNGRNSRNGRRNSRTSTSNSRGQSASGWFGRSL